MDPRGGCQCARHMRYSLFEGLLLKSLYGVRKDFAVRIILSEDKAVLVVRRSFARLPHKAGKL